MVSLLLWPLLPYIFTEGCYDFGTLIIIEGYESEKESIMRCNPHIYCEVRLFIEIAFISSVRI